MGADIRRRAFGQMRGGHSPGERLICRAMAVGPTRCLIEFDEARKFQVDRIVDVRRAACESAGGVGDRYICRIGGQDHYLWFEKGRWFVAARKQ